MKRAVNRLICPATRNLLQFPYCVQSQSQWQPMQNTYGAVFEASTLPSAPLDVRITNANSQQVVAS